MIKSGTLPPGLSLDSASGIISGTAGAAGRYQFAAEAVDAKGGRAAATLTMRVVTEEVEQAWGRSFGGDGADEGRAVATDPDGNSYVAGGVYNGNGYDAVLLKYDRAGQLLWARSYDTGEDERAYSVARDPSGNLYLAGVKGAAENLLLKYDADGNLIWSQVWDSPQLYGRTSVPRAAVDGAGNVYTVSGGSLKGVGDAVELDRFDSAGNRIWSKTHQSVYTTVGGSIAVDEEGNVYFGGASVRYVNVNGVTTAYHDYLLAKYDSSGNVLWSRTLPEGVVSIVKGIAAYGGNLFATGSTSTASTTYGVTMRFDSAGNLLWSSTNGDKFYPNAIALAAGNIYVTGELKTLTGGVSGVDFQTVKYDSLGNEKWRRTLDAGGTDGALGIVADLAGFIVTGYGKDGGNSEIVTARYNDSNLTDDLSVTGLSGELTKSTLAYAVTVKNSGTGNPTANVALRFSKDAVPSPDDYLVTLVDAGSVPGGTEKMLTGSVIVPPSVPSGTYYLTAFADPADLSYETDENNNGAAAAGTYDVIASGTDLQVGALTASVAGGNLTYSVAVKNDGNIAAAAFGTGIYLWSGETANRFENRVALVSTGPIAAGDEVVLTGTVAVPSTVPARSYFVVAMSDAASAIAETDESNNALVGSQVTVSNDLSISAVSATINGATLNYAVKVKNSGTANPTAAVSLRLSTDAVYSADDRLILTINAANVPGGTEKALSGSVALPAFLPAGKYYLLAMADPNDAVAETDETNNEAAAGAYDVAATGSDLQVGAITASVAAGNLVYSVSVKNAGISAAAASTTDLYLSPGGATAPWRVASVATGAIAGGGEIVLTGKANLASTIPSGSYWVVATSDQNNAVPETDETNNSGTTASQVTFSNDLSISGLSGTISAGALSYTVSARNTGNGNSTTAVYLYLSPDAAASGNGALVTQINGVNIPGGSENKLTGTVAVPATLASGAYYLSAVIDRYSAVTESDESNNGTAGPQLSVNRDLQVQSVSATVAGGKVTFSVTVQNVGNVATTSSSTGLYLSADGTASASDYLVSKLSTSAIAPGAQAVLSGSLALPATIPSGSYTVAAIADVANQVLESAEGNNGAVGNQVTVANDLTVTGLSGTLESGKLVYTVKVGNAGTGSAVPGVVLYFSPDAVPSSNDYLVTKVSGASIAAGNEQILTGTVLVPGTIPSGTYYLAALADAANAVNESNETNNAAVAETFTVSSDLQVPAVSATLAAGKITYTVTVANNGNVASPASTTRLLLSVDGTASPAGYNIVSIPTAPLAAGAVATLSGTAALPATIPAGSYTVAAIADAGSVMKESNETNNGAVGNLVTISNDFSITGVSGTLSNGRLTYTVKVANAGIGSSGTAVGLYFSADQVPSTGDYLVATAKATSVPGGSEVTLTGTVALPAAIASGTYYLAALADPDSAATESSESNNGAAGAQFTVNSDLRVDAVYATLAAGKLSYQVTVRNNGNIGSPSSYTGLYLSVDGTASMSDYSVASIITPPIAAGGVTTLSGTAAVPGTVAPGSYTVAAIADNSGVMFESDESNNGTVGNAVSLTNDLSITELSGTLSNGQLSYTVKVGNAGSGNPSAGIALYLSTDQVASTSDYLITTKTASIPGGTGATLTGTVAVPAGLPTGTYYLVALADPATGIPETSESNNGGVGGQFAVSTDLLVDSVSATLAAGKLSYTVNVRNNGNISAASTSTQLYLSVDGTVSTSVQSVPVSTAPLAPGAVAALKGTVSLPATVAPATYLVAARADSADSMKESNEGNNGAVGNQVTLSNDLTITALSGTLSNGQLTYNIKVSNSGTGNPSAGIALYFSADQAAATSDYLVTTKTASIPAGTEMTLTGTVTVPPGTPSGTYYLAALADAANAVVEVNESNNSATAEQFTVGSDLQIGPVSGTITAGVLSYSVTVKNTGNIAAASSSTGVYLSTDGTATTSDYRLSAITTSSLAAGAEKILTGKVTVPLTIPPGSYFVAAVANASGAVKESNATNNGAVGNTVAR